MLVTRGNVDMVPIIASLPFPQVIVWNNRSRGRGNELVYGRYKPIFDEATADAIYVQDDDCLLPPESIRALLAAHEPGALVANMPERFRQHYPDSALVGFGAVFDWHLPATAFLKWRDGGHKQLDARFKRCCDVVFTTLTERRILVDVAYEDMPYASDSDRMWKQPGHYGERIEVLELARKVRDRLG